MRRLLAIAVPAVLLLVLPSPASAKGIVGAKVCGADGCRTVAKADESLLGGGAKTSGPSRREPFVRLDITVGVPDHTQRIRLLYLPRSELLLGADGKTWMQPLTLSELRVIAARVRPFAASGWPASAPLAAARGASSTGGGGKASVPVAESGPATEFGPAAQSGAAADPGTAPASREAPIRSPASSTSDGGAGSWWLVAAAAAAALVAGFALARRRRRGPPAKAASAGY